MNWVLFLFILSFFWLSHTHAEDNQSVTKVKSKEVVDNHAKKIKIEKEVQEQMKREKKYAKEKTFYQGDDYNLSAFEIDKDSLSSVPELEPDYDFDMSSGVYTD